MFRSPSAGFQLLPSGCMRRDAQLERMSHDGWGRSCDVFRVKCTLEMIPRRGRLVLNFINFVRDDRCISSLSLGRSLRMCEEVPYINEDKSNAAWLQRDDNYQI
ncbi:hypothetical protein RSAG8_09208, partial [Rhizoctonia solani AG-8 WAC10335]